MKKDIELKDLYSSFREPNLISLLIKKISKLSEKLCKKIHIMEVCGGHTHAIIKYGLDELLKESIEFIHGPGCPVCVMPKERVDEAYILAMQKDTILVTLGDMIKVPGSYGSLQDVRANGSDVRFVYAPFDVLEIAKKNPDKKVIFFAIGFETTTPMSAHLIKERLNQGISNLFFHINHVRVPEPIFAIMNSKDSKIDAFIGPSHVSVITGSKIYEPIVEFFNTPVVVCGFEPIDILLGVEMILNQLLNKSSKVEIEYTRSVTRDGNIKAQEMIDTFFERRDFRWRGLGDIPLSSYGLKDEFKSLDVREVFEDLLPKKSIDDHKLCICGDILKGLKKPTDCPIFGTACTPKNPFGSCMVSNEGACSAYFRYKMINT